MRRLLRKFALSVLIVIVGGCALAQFRRCVAFGPFGMLTFGREGLIYFDRPGEAHPDFFVELTAADPVTRWRTCFVPYFGRPVGFRYGNLPWVWIIFTWGIGTAIVYRLTRRKPTAFPVGEPAPPGGYGYTDGGRM